MLRTSLLALVVSLVAPAGASAAFCPPLFVPEGYQMTCRASGGGKDWRLFVRPETPGLPGLSKLTLRPVEEPVDDPDIWLREKLAIDFTGLVDAFAMVLEEADVPLDEPPLEEPFAKWRTALAVLGQLPLQGCGFPHMLKNSEDWQIECDWELGPLRQHAILRLAYRGGEPYLVTIWAMNPKRLRHLVAIANSF